jgi:hypothetical protein
MILTQKNSGQNTLTPKVPALFVEKQKTPESANAGSGVSTSTFINTNYFFLASLRALMRAYQPSRSLTKS